MIVEILPLESLTKLLLQARTPTINRGLLQDHSSGLSSLKYFSTGKLLNSHLRLLLL